VGTVLPVAVGPTSETVRCRWCRLISVCVYLRARCGPERVRADAAVLVARGGRPMGAAAGQHVADVGEGRGVATQLGESV
jgi:hypothetical protein